MLAVKIFPASRHRRLGVGERKMRERTPVVSAKRHWQAPDAREQPTPLKILR